jgi:integrase
MSELLLDRAGRRRSPATMPGFHAGRPPRNKGLRYPADPPKVEEIVAVMRTAGDGAHGHRLRGLIVILWRAGLRIQEALALAEADLDHRRGALLVRRGKGGRRREVGMDAWAWEELHPWLELRLELPVGTAPARPQQPRHHLDLPAGHRQRRDHRNRPCPPRADDPSQRVARALIDSGSPALLVARSDSELRSRIACMSSAPAVRPATSHSGSAPALLDRHDQAGIGSV